MIPNINRYFRLLVILLLSISCKSNHYNDLPSDFAFCLKGETNTINTFDSTLTRRYYKNNKTIKITFSKANLASIYKNYINLGLDDLPDNYNPKVRSSMPAFVDNFTIRINGKTKSIVYSSDFTCIKFKDKYYYLKLKIFFSSLHEIINNNVDYNSIEKSNVILR